MSVTSRRKFNGRAPGDLIASNRPGGSGGGLSMPRPGPGGQGGEYGPQKAGEAVLPLPRPQDI